MKLTNVEKFAVQGMLQNGKTSDDIAKEINKPVELIDGYLTELNVSLEKVSKVKTTKQKAAPKKINSNDVLAKKTISGNRLHGAMMTKAGAERGDEFEKHQKPKNWDAKIHIIDPSKK